MATDTSGKKRDEQVTRDLRQKSKRHSINQMRAELAGNCSESAYPLGSSNNSPYKPYKKDYFPRGSSSVRLRAWRLKRGNSVASRGSSFQQDCTSHLN